jgi:uncharacterized protein (TIGR02611 family)
VAEDRAGSGTSQDERVRADRYQPRPPKWLRPVRDRVTALPGGRTVWRVLIGVIGAVIVVIGLLLIPLPGPGWALVFVGVALWATEFQWANRLLQFGRRVLSQWTDWAKRQSLVIRLLLGLVGLLVLAGLALLGWRTFH